jgi:NADH-quinone oxidoreductase subunit A
MTFNQNYYNYLLQLDYNYYLSSTYFYLIQLAISTFILCCIFIILAYVIAEKNLYYEKVSGYECGFDPFSDAREPFSIKFYLISILFILFDIELIYFFPWVSIIKPGIYISIYISMYIFFIILLIGFFYE